MARFLYPSHFYVYLWVLVRACLCVHACACMLVRACLCVHACACMRVRACVCVHACACMRVRACVCACMRVCVHACVRMPVHGKRGQFFRVFDLTRKRGKRGKLSNTSNIVNPRISPRGLICIRKFLIEGGGGGAYSRVGAYWYDCELTWGLIWIRKLSSGLPVKARGGEQSFRWNPGDIPGWF